MLADFETFLGYSSTGERSQYSDQYGVGVSFKAISVAVVIGATVAIVPIIFALVKIPEHMVVMSNNSVVMAAACHCRTTTRLPSDETPPAGQDISGGTPRDDASSSEEASSSTKEKEPSEEQVHVLHNMATAKLKWGVVSRGANTAEQPGHLAFGTEDHGEGVERPVDGDWYAG